MKRKKIALNYRPFFALLVVVLLGASTSSEKWGMTSENKDQIKAGFVQVNITPNFPMPMSGYAGRAGSFTDVRDSLFATVLVFTSGNERSAIITTDLIGFSHDFWKEMTTDVAGETGIPADHVLLIATHNHGGPVTKVYGDEDNGPVDKYMAGLKTKLVQAVEDANETLQPVRIGYGTGTCKMNINRRCMHPDGGVWLGKNPYGVCDHDVGVIRIDDMDSNPLALFVNWACHATTNGQENMRITADWPGATARVVKRALGNNLVMAVTAGASGDIDPIYGPNDNFNHIDEIGLRMGEEVIRVAKEIETKPQSGLAVNLKEITVPGKKKSASRMPGEKLEPGDDVLIRLSAMTLGDLTITGISGEVMTEIGLNIKELDASRPILVTTHCNGSSGYLCTDKAYEEGGYEAMVSRTMPGVESAIVNGMSELLSSVQ